MELENPIRFIDFQKFRTPNSNMPNEGVIYNRNRNSPGGSPFQLRLAEICRDGLEKGYGFIRIAVNDLTNEIFIVMDKANGLRIQTNKSTKDKTMRISSKAFITWLESRLDLPAGGGIIVFSDNLNRNKGFTFRLTAKRSK